MFNHQFDNNEAVDGADYLLRKKSKKAEVKIKKAEKAAAKGNVKKAQRKLDKGVKTIGKLAPDAAKTKQLSDKAQAAQAKVNDTASKQAANVAALTQGTTTQPEPISPLMQPLDPVATQSGASTPGWTPGSSGSENPGWGGMATGGGGGGSADAPDLGSDPGAAIQDEWNKAALQDMQDSPDAQAVEATNEQPAGNKTFLIIGAVILIAVVVLFTLKKSK